MQKARFPMEVLKVTQGYGYAYDGVPASTFSHQRQYALDLAGVDRGKDWAYAPFDMVCRRIYGPYNAMWFESLEKVMCADGVARVLVIQCLHMNNADKLALGSKVGKIYHQGDKFYREGTAGYATGNHIHFEVGEGPFSGRGWHVEYEGGKQYWPINNKLIPSKVLFLGPDVKQANPVYNWKVDNGTSPTPPTTLYVFKPGDLVQIIGSTYYNGAPIPIWVKKHQWYITSIADDRVVLGDSEDHKFSINSPVKISDIRDIDNNPPPCEKRLVDGDELSLLKAPLYRASISQKPSSYKTGTYYVWSEEVIQGKVRITNRKDRVGVKGQVTGWMLYQDALECKRP